MFVLSYFLSNSHMYFYHNMCNISWGDCSIVGGFLLSKVKNFQLCMFPRCSHCFTGFRTHFVFSVAQLLPMLVNFFENRYLQWGYSWGNFQQSILGHNFWLEWPTDVRSTPLSYIFNALFRDTPLGHVFGAQPNSQIAKYPNIWLIWLFGYLAARKKHGQVGYPWKEH